MRSVTVPRTPWGLVVLAVLTMLAVVALAHPTQPEPATAPASAEVGATPSPKYHYTSRETVTGAYITTTGTPTALADGWATGPTPTQGIWYANGDATAALLISSTATVTRIVWILPDGSQRIQEGDLTYYNPETGEYQ